ncbi:MAG: 50S ribosomal protein L11 methyltransferase [Chlorobi bacterium]|nr:MAG: 50S ribosomal protein L11 methyltransferase [Bacteroidota bacterium]KXK35346.1 MAG: 50S ribosomal protein L11 methyltransferase [Chlorobi bacterium OLB6]MBE2264872.1 50S ribosomal protein L11 methyltransferase [Flavobacteriales bacterium]MBL1160748.1 50S ribosomal protein L11 methyltransferase [Chlorobiota bacterium]MBW7853099.1 50S ribosomal protein L11 methyltransferase [Candidatus Kapabacteria bacterium]MCC6331412.1 50S ribosomal protein L11 methyltransferase [Ignavibacteria bacteri
MQNSEYTLITVAVPEEQTEVATAIFSAYPILGIEVGLDSMVVCFPGTDWNEQYRESMLEDLHSAGVSAAIIRTETLAEKNWNEAWEANIEPIVVNERITIAPEWHADSVTAPLTLIVTPKMSFGTGHHATTRMMCKLLETEVHQGSVWVDVGTGTGVLAILAVKLGAASVFAFDNNEWSILNAHENIDKNHAGTHITLEQLDLQTATLPSCDGITANLYRHLVIPFAPHFIGAVKPGGVIIVSGILKYDRNDVVQPFTALNCTIKAELAEDEWCAITFETPQ